MSTTSQPIVNRVAASGLITLDLQEIIPEYSIVEFDLKDHLFQGLILKEKDFRSALKEMDWSRYQDQYVALYCSADAIIPKWSYMLVASYLKGVSKEVYFGDAPSYFNHLVSQFLSTWDVTLYADQRVMLQGCGDERINEASYLAATNKLLPVVKSLMYGEPCSNVPIYKKPK